MQLALVADTGALVPAELAADNAGLRYIAGDLAGITRRRAGKGFVFVGADGKPLRDEKHLERIRKLAIPPAWTEVWICPHPDGHLQATGFDARGRKQYRYNDDFRRLRETAKFEHMLVFAQALPALRKRVAADLAKNGLPREKVLATIVNLLETTLVRVGNKDYAEENDSYGLTTLRTKHVAVAGDTLRFRFKGKSGKLWQLKVSDRRVAKVVRACQELPGQQLFEYLGSDGTVQTIGSADVNAYLKEISGREITAKDFRTWYATVAAAVALFERGRSDIVMGNKKTAREVVCEVAARLGNTPTICRKCYIHPEVLDAYAHGTLRLDIRRVKRTRHALSAEEAAVFRFLTRRLAGGRRVKPA